MIGVINKRMPVNALGRRILPRASIIAIVGITPQCFLDLQSQAIHAASHITS
jgi:hypothetical protein